MRNAAPQQPLQLIADADPHAVEPDMQLAVPQVAGNPLVTGAPRTAPAMPAARVYFWLSNIPSARFICSRTRCKRTHIVTAGFFAQIVKEQLRQTAASR